MKVEFVSYNGDYPNLCSGTLVMRVDGVEYTFPPFCLRSGGDCYIDDDGSEVVTIGSWYIRSWPEKYPSEAKPETRELVQANIPEGCCGGCL